MILLIIYPPSIVHVAGRSSFDFMGPYATKSTILDSISWFANSRDIYIYILQTDCALVELFCIQCMGCNYFNTTVRKGTCTPFSVSCLALILVIAINTTCPYIYSLYIHLILVSLSGPGNYNILSFKR